MDLNFKKYGESGAPLIILHGFLGSLDNWHTLSTQFANNFTVYNIDQRNHGKSPHANEHSIAHMVNDLNLFLKNNHLHAANIIGHSMGGKVAMQFALQYPEMTNKLIVADIAPRLYPQGHTDVFDAIFAVDLNRITSRKEAEEFMTPHITDFGTRQFLLKNLERNSNGTFSWKMNLDVLYKYYEEIIKSGSQFNNPSLFLKGGNSNYIQEKDLTQIKSLFPNYKLHTLPNAGHWLHAEQPELFYNTVTQFLNA
jgi:esterase